MEALVQSYKKDIEKTTLKSPMAGRVITPRVELMKGIYLRPGQRDLLLQVEDNRTIHAEIEVPEEDSADVRIDADVRVATWTFPDERFEGKVAWIAPIAMNNTGEQPNSVPGADAATAGAQVRLTGSSWKVVRVLCEIPNEDGLLKADMTGFAKIATRNKPVWRVLLNPIIRWFKVQFWYWVP